MRQFDVYWVRLDPTLGREIKKTRPAVIISSNKDIGRLSTIIIAPLTSTIKPLSSRVDCQFQGRNGSIVLDQLRAIDKLRLEQKMGKLEPIYQKQVSTALQRLFK